MCVSVLVEMQFIPENALKELRISVLCSNNEHLLNQTENDCRCHEFSKL